MPLPPSEGVRDLCRRFQDWRAVLSFTGSSFSKTCTPLPQRAAASLLRCDSSFPCLPPGVPSPVLPSAISQAPGPGESVFTLPLHRPAAPEGPAHPVVSEFYRQGRPRWEVPAGVLSAVLTPKYTRQPPPSGWRETGLFLGSSGTARRSKARPEATPTAAFRGRRAGEGRSVKRFSCQQKKVQPNATPNRLPGEAGFWPSPDSRPRVRPTRSPLRGLAWQPCEAHTLRPVVVQQSSQRRPFPSPQRAPPGLWRPPFIPRKRCGCS